MTNQELIDFYASLLILQYIGKPKARATIQAQVTPIIMDQLPLAVQLAYGVDDSAGVQLDIVGKFVGVSRSTLTFTGPVVLNDDDFRVMIKIKIAQNTSGSSLYDIQSFLFKFFPGTILVFDYQNMHMDYFFDSVVGSMQLAEVLVRQGLLPKPMGVQLGALIYAADITNFFGLRTYSLPAFNVSPLNSYSSYQTGRPWLSYSNAVIP